MELNVAFKFTESYLPSKRHRKLRWREAQDETLVNIPEVTREDAPIAFVATEGVDETADYHWYNEQVWKPVKWGDMVCRAEGLFPVGKFIEWLRQRAIHPYGVIQPKEEAIAVFEKLVCDFIIVDGIVCRKSGEPRYVINTFGLGHNHGGTSLSIDTHYNGNIHKNRYYNALDKERAIADTIEIATNRGDDKSIPGIGVYWVIDVLMPEAVRCNPQSEHGEGDPFLNQIYGLTEESSSPVETALLVMSAALK